jgi:hypothetical protein
VAGTTFQSVRVKSAAIAIAIQTPAAGKSIGNAYEMRLT